jgi:hypothetical protein
VAFLCRFRPDKKQPDVEVDPFLKSFDFFSNSSAKFCKFPFAAAKEEHG